MSTSSFGAQVVGDAVAAASRYGLVEWLKRHATPYHLFVAGLIGAATVGFAVVIGLLILVATNFNLLGLIE